MPDFLNAPLASAGRSEPLGIVIRLAVALVLGLAVAWIYRGTHPKQDLSPSFPATLIFLAVLIAMVTQVIGDNVARAFSLVGALSIVRFRTVVRDTEDTAYVIFAVAVGMAAGADDVWVAGVGLTVMALAAFGLKARPLFGSSEGSAFVLNVRLPLGPDIQGMLAPTLSGFVRHAELLTIETARQGLSLDVTYQLRLVEGAQIDRLVLALNQVEGVQSVQLQRRGFQAD